MAEIGPVYAICCSPEVAGDVISDRNVNTIECYAVVNFEASGSAGIFKQIPTAAADIALLIVAGDYIFTLLSL